MKHPWLTLLTFGFLSVVVLFFFGLYAEPLELPSNEPENLPDISSPSVTYVNPKKGAEEPVVQIIEFGDFECRHCSQLADDLDAVVETYPDKVQVVWKDMPNTSTHPNAEQAAIAAHCAKRQGKFWEYHDQLFAQQSLMSQSLLRSVARDLDLNMDQFSQCLESQDTLPVVRRDLEEGLALKLNATPTLFIGDERLVGQVSRQEVMQLVRQRINQSQQQTN
jgi:protein-disulfide isomerase